MKAYQYESAATGLVAVQLPIPQPGEGEVLIDVQAAGMCLSDVHIVNGQGDGMLGKRPIVLGHEVAGTISALGARVEGFDVGDRVAVAQVAHPVGEHNVFSDGIGLGFDGSYAEKAVAPVRNLVRIPDDVVFTDAAVATDAVATAYHAVVAEAGVGPDSTVAVIGLGGLGLNAVRIAALRGATVYGVDVEPATFDAAAAQGARACFTAVADVSDPIDAVVDFAGAGTTTADAVTAVKPGGRVVVVGLGEPEIPVPSQQLVLKNVQLRGSFGASLDELGAVLDLIAAGCLKPVVEEFAFDDLPTALKRLETGDVRGRLVTRPAESR
ncbi:zinc-binding dehydrogenase [Mycolicibacterium sp. XJ1819]